MQYFFSALPFLLAIVLIKSLVLLCGIYFFCVIFQVKERKKFLLTSLVLLVIGLIPLNMELVFSPYPYVDTIFAEKFSADRWKEITPGMKKIEVEQKIGVGFPNGPWTMLPSEGEKVCVGYTRDGKIELVADFAWIGVGVCYNSEEIVTRTYENIVQD